MRKLCEMVDSQQEQLHCARAEEVQRRDQQLLQGQLLQQNWDLREAYEKSLNENEELKRFQGSIFNTIARRKLVEDQDTVLQIMGKIQELQNEINCMNDSKEFQDAVEVPTLPVDQCHSHFIQFLKECLAVLLECRAAKMGRQAFGTHMVYRETFLQIQMRHHQHFIFMN